MFEHITSCAMDDGSEIYSTEPNTWYITDKRRQQWLCRDGKPRTCELAWLTNLRDQCLAAGVPYYLK